MQIFFDIYYFFYDFFTSSSWQGIYFWLQVFAAVISTALIFGIGALTRKLNTVKVKLKEVETLIEGVPQYENPVLHDFADEWKAINKKFESGQQSDWKLAIMEADNLLDSIFQQISAYGQDMGERLKSLSKEQLSNIDDVWKAHKLRNELAHSFSSEVREKEVKAALDAYEQAMKYLGVL